MQFPVYHVPWLGDGMTIGLNGVIHVVVSHGVAIGVITLLWLCEWWGPADHAGASPPHLGEAASWRAFRRRVLRFAVILVTTVGAITGAGIWFTTTALAPRGIASMLRIFFWPWFIEWGVFIAEVLVLLVIYHRWRALARRPRRRRLVLGVYVLLAVTTAVLITGNLAFMLTPGGWNRTGRFADAFFNPSYPPQLLARLSLALVIGVIFVMLLAVVGRGDARFRRAVLSRLALVLAVALPVLVGAVVWYIAVVPPVFTDSTLFAVLTSHLTPWAGWLIVANVAAAALLLGLVGLAPFASRRVVGALAGVCLLVMVGFTAQFERVREFIRGPYLMPGYMYVNGVLTAEQGLLAEGTIVDRWAGVEPADAELVRGAAVFARQCAACHTIGGPNDIRRRAAGRSEAGLIVMVDHTHDLASFMPPAAAHPDDRRALARFIFAATYHDLAYRSRSRVTLEPAAAGQPPRPGSPPPPPSSPPP